MSSTSPLISVIVAVFNGAKTLQRCLDSICEQSYPHIELIIMDGASTDGTFDILKANNKKISYWESKSDKGIYHAWNKALDHVHGDWVCFLGADDYFWKSNVLELMAPNLTAVPMSNKVVYGKVAMVSKDNEIIEIVGKSWDISRRDLLRKMCLPHQGVMHHRTLFECRGRFDESFKISGDYDLLLRELKTENADFVGDVIVAGMQVGGISNSFRNIRKAIKEGDRAVKKNGLPSNYIYNYLRMLYIYVKLSKLFIEKKFNSLLKNNRKINESKC